MTVQESIEERLARIEEHIKHIDVSLALFTETIIDHDRKINQWTGACAAVALICSIIGGLIGVLLTKVLK